ncbi:MULTISPECIES: DinB family protein [Aneurinibacillus]|uniref:DinB family protein n=2 Tax=Aneurinibacillus thermoaerophilus TaxID=143495 RepID=A0A1G8F746_ANETH|nr:MULTISPECIES: DinB family protein [Aneurinibacillus]AMA71532.1 hypothetical protein ACH33_00905 [Aneurinibacillus sp. XH2]MED0675173.1 DinB family protein [Aneurinibacillus thermoaerophilus]MED0735730.1 DinB family protein [Aneurinibacillus thermoaerophilus]MED0758548.1 DinB family protein [Aneurinibacillus thermoaerophilus]MED0762259.1 DinB family protein [Aneurinibacillus thermoaerophilus]
MKNELVLKQFIIARRRLLKALEDVTEEMAAKKPEGFNNNIHWHAGHILSAAEQFLFRLPGGSVNIPDNYKDFFANGTKPDDWKETPPSFQQIVAQLKEQEARVKDGKDSIEERLDETLVPPFTLRSGLRMDTVGELINMAIYHEGVHTGYISAMKRIIG